MPFKSILFKFIVYWPFAACLNLDRSNKQFFNCVQESWPKKDPPKCLHKLMGSNIQSTPHQVFMGCNRSLSILSSNVTI